MTNLYWLCENGYEIEDISCDYDNVTHKSDKSPTGWLTLKGVRIPDGEFTLTTSTNNLPYDYLRKIILWLKEQHVEYVLTNEEKEYLKAVIAPFRDRVLWIKKERADNNYECISICVTYTNNYGANNIECMHFPVFKAGEKYKQMKLDEPYSLKTLRI